VSRAASEEKVSRAPFADGPPDQEVVARLAIGIGHRGGGQLAVGGGRVGVEVAAIEPALAAER
jgi:hypothetical protein